MDFELQQQDAAIIFDENEIEFYGFIRNHVIVFQTLIFLYAISYYLIRKYSIRQDNDELYTGDEDFLVYRISTWMSALSLAIAIGEIFLMPMTRFGFELMHIFPNNFYIKWLSNSLLLCIWNYMFFLDNLSLFVLLPFAYFFIESQGLSLLRRPHRPFLARVSETCLLCFLLIFLLVCIVDLIYTLLFNDKSFSFAIFYFTSLTTPLLHSFVSAIGVIILMLSIPFGFVKMFDLMSGALTPSFLTNKNQKILPSSADILKIKSHIRSQKRYSFKTFQKNLTLPFNKSLPLLYYDGGLCNSNKKTFKCNFFQGLKNINYFASETLRTKSQTTINPLFLTITKRSKPFFKSCLAMYNFLKCPFMMVILLFFSILSVTIVIVNISALIFGFRELPDYAQHLEVHSRHFFGFFGVFMEIALIFYIIGASFVGVYSLPVIRNIRPQSNKTSMTCIILNCGIALLLSSAVPVLSRILGITSFDLLGEYGRITWISDFSFIITCNIIFASCLTFCLANRFTYKVRRQLFLRFSLLFSSISSCSLLPNEPTELLVNMEKNIKLE